MQELRLNLRFYALFVAIFLSTSMFSQGTIKGFVSSKSTGEPVMFVSVLLEGTKYGVSTDITGFYSLSRVPAGTYNLIVSSIEYKNIKEVVEVVSGKVRTKNYLLEDGVIQLASAEVNADREEQLTSVRMSVETIRPAG